MAALLSAMTLSATLAGTVAAVNNSVVEIILGDCAISGGTAGFNRTVKVEWRDADGNLKDKQSVVSDGSGDWHTSCVLDESLEIGDSIKTTIGTISREFIVPLLTARIDRVANTVRGKTTASADLGVVVYTYDGQLNPDNASVHGQNLVSDAVGDYVVDFDGGDIADIKGYDDVAVLWFNQRGDAVVIWRTAPGMTARIRTNGITSFGNPGADVTFTLYAEPGGAVRSTTGGTLWEGNNGFSFYDADAVPVRVAAGNQVTADLASDASLVVPSLSATISTNGDSATVNCGLGAGVGVKVDLYKRDYSKFKTRYGSTNGSGLFVASAGFDLRRSDKVRVTCVWETGDRVERLFTAP